MPKLNLIGMVVLSLAVAGGAAVLALRGEGPRPDSRRLGSLLRQLGDPDPDIRRDAERELKAFGPRATAALREAADGPDPVLAGRARALLGLKPVDRPQEPPDGVAIADPPAPVEGVRLSLQVTSNPGRPGEAVRYYLRLHNGGRKAIAIACHRRNGPAIYVAFGVFERIDAEGRVVALQEDPDPDTEDDPAELGFVTVSPGETLDLAPGAGVLRVGASGTFNVRFAYEASEGSAYRKALTGSHHAASALPSERIVSNAVAINVP
ncbi:MAG TPA: hypothetical protein VGK61_10785 [Planctomycetota bacterium]|jgi:hypothetical protein